MTTDTVGREPQAPSLEPAPVARRARRWPWRIGLVLALLASIAVGGFAAHLTMGRPTAAAAADARRDGSLAQRPPDVDPSVPQGREGDYRAAMAAIGAYQQQWLTLYASGADPATAAAALPGTTARFAAEEAARYAYFREVGSTLAPGGTWVVHSGRWASGDAGAVALDVCDSRMIGVTDDDRGEFRQEEPRAPWRYHLVLQDGSWLLSAQQYLPGTC